MNENYLWDKTGSDAEIEELEATLQILRHQEKSAPKLTTKILPFKPKTVQQRAFPAMLKVAACIAVGVIALTVWIQIFRKSTNYEQAVSQTLPQIENKTVQPETDSSNEPTVAPAILVTKDAAKNTAADKKVYQARYKIAPIVLHRAERKRGKPIEIAEAAVQLTKEEKYAYEQLMLALSITSSNLKAVKNQAEGLE